jgi:hypothetical protein
MLGLWKKTFAAYGSKIKFFESLFLLTLRSKVSKNSDSKRILSDFGVSIFSELILPTNFLRLSRTVLRESWGEIALPDPIMQHKLISSRV